MIKQDKQDFIYNVETLATSNDKEKLYDEILKLKPWFTVSIDV